jgi:nicotinamide riboside kinase
LAIVLSKILQGIYVNEYARNYLNKHKTYTINDLDIFAFKQNEIINNASQTENNFLIADTSIIVIEIWSMLKYKKLSKSIKRLSEKENFDYYLLCKPDIPWKWDKQREAPNDRIKIYNAYKNLLSTRNYNYTVIGGKLNQRIKSSLNFII